MSLLYGRPSGLPQLAGYVAITSFFRVCESVANKERGKKKGSQLQDSAFLPCIPPHGRAVFHAEMDHVNTATEEILQTDALETQPTFKASGREVVSANSPALGPSSCTR